MDIRDVADADIPDMDFQAVLITSANGVKALARHAAFARLKAAVAVTVGQASGAAAREAGFMHVVTANGDVAGLIEVVKGRLLRMRDRYFTRRGARSQATSRAYWARWGSPCSVRCSTRRWQRRRFPRRPVPPSRMAAPMASGPILHALPASGADWCRVPGWPEGLAVLSTIAFPPMSNAH